MEPVNILVPMSDYLQTNNVFKDMIKEAMWFLVKFLKNIVDAIQTAINSTYDALTLSAKDVMGTHMSAVGVIAIAVLGVALCILGYKFMYKRESKKSSAFTGILLVLVISIGLPLIFDAGLSIFNSSTNGGNKIEAKFTDKIICENIVDLAASIDEQDFGVQNEEFKPKHISDEKIENIKYIDITEVLNRKKSKEEFTGSNAKENLKTLDKELHFKNDGTVDAVDFDGNKFINKNGYYRYQANWFAIFSSFVIVTVTLVLMGIKIAKILFQLVLDRIVGTILIFSDLEEGKRAKELLNHVITTFTMLLVSVMSMNIYISLISTFANKIQGGGLTKTIAYALVLLGTSLALLEGSQVIEKLMGTRVDSGLGKTSAGLMGMAMMASKATQGAKSVGKTAMSAGKTTGKGAMAVGGAGVKGGMAVGGAIAKPIKYASDKTGATDKINNGVENASNYTKDKVDKAVGNASNYAKDKAAKVGNVVDKVQGKVDNGLEKFGERVGWREPSDNSNKANPMNTGFGEQETIKTGTEEEDSSQSGFSAIKGNLAGFKEGGNSLNSTSGGSSATRTGESTGNNGADDFDEALKKHQKKAKGTIKKYQLKR